MCPPYRGYLRRGGDTVSRWGEAFRASYVCHGDIPQGAVTPAPAWPDPGTPERARLDQQHAGIVAGLRRAALQRPPSWDDPAALPSPGCRCCRCDGQRWTEAPGGWRCASCYPGDHLTATPLREVRTCRP